MSNLVVIANTQGQALAGQTNLEIERDELTSLMVSDNSAAEFFAQLNNSIGADYNNTSQATKIFKLKYQLKKEGITGSENQLENDAFTDKIVNIIIESDARLDSEDAAAEEDVTDALLTANKEDISSEDQLFEETQNAILESDRNALAAEIMGALSSDDMDFEMGDNYVSLEYSFDDSYESFYEDDYGYIYELSEEGYDYEYEFTELDDAFYESESSFITFDDGSVGEYFSEYYVYDDGSYSEYDSEAYYDEDGSYDEYTYGSYYSQEDNFYMEYNTDSFYDNTDGTYSELGSEFYMFDDFSVESSYEYFSYADGTAMEFGSEYYNFDDGTSFYYEYETYFDGGDIYDYEYYYFDDGSFFEYETITYADGSVETITWYYDYTLDEYFELMNYDDPRIIDPALDAQMQYLGGLLFEHDGTNNAPNTYQDDLAVKLMASDEHITRLFFKMFTDADKADLIADIPSLDVNDLSTVNNLGTYNTNLGFAVDKFTFSVSIATTDAAGAGADSTKNYEAISEADIDTWINTMFAADEQNTVALLDMLDGEDVTIVESIGTVTGTELDEFHYLYDNDSYNQQFDGFAGNIVTSAITNQHKQDLIQTFVDRLEELYDDEVLTNPTNDLIDDIQDQIDTSITYT